MLCCNLIQKRLLFPARYACLMQRGAGRSGCITFVYKHCLNVKTACQTPRKTPAQVRHFMRYAIAMARQSDDQQNGLPFLNQRMNGGEALIVFFAVNGCQRMREFQGGVADSDANAFPAKIKRQHSTISIKAVDLLY